ncbi:hypothetical protein Syun_007957 [Stephania yunnanensis]|uniref:Pectinesterase n=1 Tax=Stephania yunnanensis TaxID=152371 RepID=A0AAP0KZI7_9MAGN
MGDSGNKKKFAVIGISSLILVAMVVGAVVTLNRRGGSDDQASGGDGGAEVHSSMKAIEAICQPTDYKKTCVESLSTAAGANTTDPKELVRIAFNVTMKHLGEAIKHSKLISDVEKDPMNQQALENCRELVEYSINDLKQSFDQLGDLEITKVDDAFNELKIWLSAAITYEETCLDGFINSTGTADHIRLGTIPSLSQRRLLSSDLPDLHSDGLPTWATGAQRRLLAIPTNKLKPNVVVAKDGSGKYKTLKQALKDIPLKGTQPFVIYVKAGIYKENVEFTKAMTHVVLVGDGPTKTKITGNKNYVDGISTFKTATVAVMGEGFMAKDIGFENSAGASKHQAVALRVGSEKSIFHNCQMDGYQDTLYAHTNRQFYRDCTISGTIDFIFGDAAVVFQNCKMVVRKPMDNQQCIVTAQGRKDKNQPTGIVLQNCVITTDPAYFPLRQKLKSYLGRPWKQFSRTIIMQSHIDDLIQPEGWLPWMGTFALDTLTYAEVNNKGPGSNMAKRVKWKGVKNLSAEQATMYTAGRFLQGDSWIPATGVPYNSGM